MKGDLSAVAATASLLLHQKDGLTFESVVPGCQAALHTHDAVERRYAGDALVEATTNLAFVLHDAHGFGTSTGAATP